jgi:hypothetical protein
LGGSDSQLRASLLEVTSSQTAEKQDPAIMDRPGAYYAKHPEVVKVLGGTALAFLLGQLAGRMKR